MSGNAVGRSAALCFGLFGGLLIGALVSVGSPAPVHRALVAYRGLLYRLADLTGRDGLEVRRDVPYRSLEGEELRLDAYIPRQGINPAVLVLHEGGWVSGSKADWEAEGRRLAEAGLAAFVADYRLSPPGGSAHAPDAVEDVRAALRWIRAHAADYRINPIRVGVLGGSAGGHLAMMLGTTGVPGQDRADAVVAWSGDSQLRRFTSGPEASYCLSFLGCSQESCPELWDAMSPYQFADRWSAPMYLANSTDEEIPLDQATLMAARMEAAGVPHELRIIEGQQHARGYEQQVMESSVAFLERHLQP